MNKERASRRKGEGETWAVKGADARKHNIRMGGNVHIGASDGSMIIGQIAPTPLNTPLIPYEGLTPHGIKARVLETGGAS